MMKQMTYMILLLAAFSSCKLSQINFIEKDFNTAFFQKCIKSVQAKDTCAKFNLDFTSIQVYKSVIQNGNVLRNGVVEETAINKYGNRKNYWDPANIRNKNTLYIIITDNIQSQQVLFVPSIQNAKDSFVRLGPAYLGNLGIDRLNFTNILYFKTARNKIIKKNKAIEKNKEKWVYLENKNKYKFKDEYTTCKSSKITLNFELDNTPTYLDMQPFRIKRIFKTSGNNISGEKPLVFDIAQIFDDPDALIFFEKDHIPQK